MSIHSIKRAFNDSSKGMVAASQKHRYPMAFKIKNFFHKLFSSKNGTDLELIRAGLRKREITIVATDILNRIPIYGQINTNTKQPLHDNPFDGYHIAIEKHELVIYTNNLFTKPSRAVLANLATEQDYNNLLAKLTSLKAPVISTFAALHRLYKQDLNNEPNIKK